MSDDPTRKTLRAEATLLRIPIFALAVRGSASLDGFEFRHVRRKGEQTFESVIRTERDEKATYPGPLSRRVHMGMLSLVTDRGFPFENPVCWTWRDLCRRMGLPNSGRRVAELKGALRASWGLKIFGMTASEGKSRESWRRLYSDCVFQNDRDADGKLADANRLWLSHWYLESLNALHSAPVDYELWKRLERVGPLASRLYEYLIPTFYKREALEIAYDRIAAAMPVVAESRRSHAVRQFSPALEALTAEGVLASSFWEAMKGTGRPKLKLERGPRLSLTAPSGAKTPARVAPSPPTIDPEAPARLASEFYRLLGKAHQPLKSDLAVAKDLLTRFGVPDGFDRLPDAVRRLKARFKNAETMGALVRYFEESVRDAVPKSPSPLVSRKVDVGEDSDDPKRRALWSQLSEPDRLTIRQAVLAEHPPFARFPALLEAACLQRLEVDPDPTQG